MTATRQNIQKDGCNKELFSFTEKTTCAPQLSCGALTDLTQTRPPVLVVLEVVMHLGGRCFC